MWNDAIANCGFNPLTWSWALIPFSLFSVTSLFLFDCLFVFLIFYFSVLFYFSYFLFLSWLYIWHVRMVWQYYSSNISFWNISNMWKNKYFTENSCIHMWILQFKFYCLPSPHISGLVSFNPFYRLDTSHNMYQTWLHLYFILLTEGFLLLAIFLMWGKSYIQIMHES